MARFDTKAGEKDFVVPLSVVVSEDDLKNLLVSALEGGSNYWYFIEEIQCPPGKKNSDYEFAVYDVPFDGGALIFTTLDDDEPEETRKKYRLDMSAMTNGLRLMCKNAKYTRHFADLMAENTDMETGDVFLQLCLFGEVLYG